MADEYASPLQGRILALEIVVAALLHKEAVRMRQIGDPAKHLADWREEFINTLVKGDPSSGPWPVPVADAAEAALERLLRNAERKLRQPPTD